MKLLKNAVIVVCLVSSVSVHAQKKNSGKTKFPPPVIIKDEENVIKSEEKKKEYKSKQWRQGIERMSEPGNNAGKAKSATKKKFGELRNVPPPPRPPPPFPPVKEKS
ncbi:MAG: hypothetical protein JWQ09_4384 [Segetibacter sp.]|nr:hypothetical protein [Segetibacter sp.]